MIDFSWTHILIVLIVALVVIGPKDLPKFMHMAGRWMGKARAMADQFRKSFDEMARQGELDELRAEIDALRNQRPLADMDRSLHQSILPADMTDAAPVMTALPSPVVEAAIEEKAAEAIPADAGPLEPGSRPPAP